MTRRSHSADPRYRSPWDYPSCPECGSSFAVDEAAVDPRHSHRCHDCNRDFGTSEVRA
jgi:predicted Zn finger-like uncharacterized protein